MEAKEALVMATISLVLELVSEKEICQKEDSLLGREICQGET